MTTRPHPSRRAFLNRGAALTGTCCCHLKDMAVERYEDGFLLYVILNPGEIVA